MTSCWLEARKMCHVKKEEERERASVWGKWSNLTTFSFFVVDAWATSAPRSTSMKSFLDTVDRTLDFFLSEPPTSFIFSSTFFWCFFSALNNCTTPLKASHKETMNYIKLKIAQEVINCLANHNSVGKGELNEVSPGSNSL